MTTTLHSIWPPTGEIDLAGLAKAYAPDPSRPTLRMNFVSSIDGAVEVGGYSRGLSSDTDRQVFHILRSHADAVMVGAGTLRHEGYGPVRVTERAVDPTLVIVSGSLDLDPGNQALVEAPVRPIVLTHARAPADRQAALADVADIIECGNSAVDLSLGLAELHSRGLNQVLCEGGPHLFGALLAADLVDEFCLTLSAMLAGSGAGRIVADGRRDVPLPMRLVRIIAADDTLFTRYARAT
jgi:riboflavin biosynthesis pyrimidine reductase